MITVSILALFLQSATVAPDTEERLRWLDTFASCSVVWDVASDLASNAPEERRLFLERRGEFILAAQKMDRSAQVAIKKAREDLRPELVQLSATNPMVFARGPFHRCSEHALTASRIAAGPNVVGSSGIIIQ